MTRQVVEFVCILPEFAHALADCFRFRNTTGLDVARSATDAWRSKRLNLDELNRIAKKLRLQRVMQPYLETIVM